ncbi:hypothetical protein J007_03177, partial [Cryptococcus neoformans]
LAKSTTISQPNPGLKVVKGIPRERILSKKPSAHSDRQDHRAALPSVRAHCIHADTNLSSSFASLGKYWDS